MADGAGDEFPKDNGAALDTLVDIESHPRLLHQPDEAQQLGVYAEGSAHIQDDRADGLIARPTQASKKAQQVK